MAILTGINTRLRGSAGDWTFSQLGGQTVAKQKVAKKAIPTRTYAQMMRRVQWANIVAIYRAFVGNLHPSFEKKKQNMSDFNEFMSANIDAAPVFLTKDQARQGGAVAAAYQLTRGSLPSIVTSNNGNLTTTDISLGTLTISASTTIKAFSEAVVQNNPAFVCGDQITCFIAHQSVNAQSQVPYVDIVSLEVTLDDSDDENLLWDVVDAEGFSTLDGKLGSGGTVDGAIAWVHSRKNDTGTLVSTQHFHVTNSHLGSYTSAAARDAAIASYGGVPKEEFLTPNVDIVVAPVNP